MLALQGETLPQLQFSHMKAIGVSNCAQMWTPDRAHKSKLHKLYGLLLHHFLNHNFSTAVLVYVFLYHCRLQKSLLCYLTHYLVRKPATACMLLVHINHTVLLQMILSCQR